MEEKTWKQSGDKKGEPDGVNHRAQRESRDSVAAYRTMGNLTGRTIGHSKKAATVTQHTEPSGT